MERLNLAPTRVCKQEKTVLIREAKKAGRAEVSSDKSSRKSDMCRNIGTRDI